MHTPPDFAPKHALPDDLPGSTLAFAFIGAQLVTRGEDKPTVLTLAEVRDANLGGDIHYLGELRGTPSVAVGLPEGATVSGDLRSSGLRQLFFRLDDELLALAARGFQIVDWDRTHRYCGRCGTPTQHKPGERARVCPACSLVAYPRVSPAMMALVVRDRELLLARAPHFTTEMYSALAGFVEPGETIEDCVRREVREEVGIEIDSPRYFGSQSWAFPHSLMIAFTARYAGGDITPDPNEIADARWFPLDALPKLPGRISIARKLIDATVQRMRAGEAP